MPTVKLPDGSTLEVAEGSRVADVANQIGPRLAKAAVAARLDGKLVDLSTVLEGEGERSLEILTDKSDEALSILRHSTSHVMAEAVRRLYGDVRFGIGPSIEDGFYYDFDLADRITEDDFERIEAEMAKIVEVAEPFVRTERPVAEVRSEMESAGQWCKVELLDDIAAQGLAEGEEIENADAKPVPDAPGRVSLYETGDFVDLCRGPHLPDAGRIPTFKLLSVSGSYWRGD